MSLIGRRAMALLLLGAVCIADIATAEEAADKNEESEAVAGEQEDDSSNAIKKQVEQLYGQVPPSQELPNRRYLERKDALKKLADRLMAREAAGRQGALDSPRFNPGEGGSPIFPSLPALPKNQQPVQGVPATPEVVISVAPVDALADKNPKGVEKPVEHTAALAADASYQNAEAEAKGAQKTSSAPEKATDVIEKKESTALTAATEAKLPKNEEPSVPKQASAAKTGNLVKSLDPPPAASANASPSKAPALEPISPSASTSPKTKIASANFKAVAETNSLSLLAPKAGGPQSKKKAVQGGKHPNPPPPEPEVAPVPPTKGDAPEPAQGPETGTFADRQATAIIRAIIGGDGVPLNVEGTSQADVGSPVHVDEAVAFALKSNFEVSASEEKSRGAYWDKMGAYAQYLPVIQMSADSGPERSRPASFNDAYGNRVADNVHHRRDRNISVTQPLIDLSIIADVLSSRDKEDIAHIDQKDVREGIAYDTASTYLSLLQARITVRLAEDYKKYLDDLAKRMKARVDGGGASNADLDRIKGRSATAESARIEALGEYQTQLAEFTRLTKVIPPELVIPEMLAPSIPASPLEALERALRTNPTYMSSLKKVELARDDRNKTFSTMLPKLSFQYSNSFSYNAGGAAEGNPADGVWPTQRTQNVMLVAQWQLNGGTPITGTISGMAKEREMNLRSLDVRSKVEQGIRSSYASINAGRERQAALKRTMEADERVVKGFEYQFANGGRSLFDLLDSYEQLYNARLNFLRVTVAVAKASYQVHRQMGELVAAIVRDQEEK